MQPTRGPGQTTFDVAVVGGGSSGAACAAFLAEAGLAVVCLERRANDDAGARWVNGVPRAAFAEAGVELPAPPEHLGGPDPFHLVLGPHQGFARPTIAITLPRHDVIHVDMRHLVRRLQARARRAGAQLRERVTVHGWDGEALATSAGPVAARYVVDASGLAGARLLRQASVPRVELCAAAQEVREVKDRGAAAAYLHQVGARPGEAMGFVGVAGGYSVLNVHLDHELTTCSVLTGSIPALGHPSGKAILDRFVAAHPWIGAVRFGGAGAIPLRRPYDRLASERVALLGDAGCQVFPAHGSGIGAGLIAARRLADTLIAGASLRDYEVSWQRQHGALLASFDALRRFSQQLDAAAVRDLFTSGLAEPELMRAGLDQQLPQLAPAALLRLISRVPGALREHPALARGLLLASARSKLVHAVYARYPRDVRHLGLWSRAVDRLLEG